MKEGDLQNTIRLHLSEHGILSFRNNSGALMDKNGRLVRYGLCVGSSDIIGIKPTVITEDMIGQTIGIFVALEVKISKGKTTPAQRRFLSVIRKAGGIGEVVKSVEEAELVFHF